jgi:hypothetical protein
MLIVAVWAIGLVIATLVFLVVAIVAFGFLLTLFLLYTD